MFDVCECDVVKDTGKEEYLRPFIHIGLDWIGLDTPKLMWKAKRANYTQYTGKNSSAIQMPSRIGWLLKRLWSIYR